MEKWGQIQIISERKKEKKVRMKLFSSTESTRDQLPSKRLQPDRSRQLRLALGTKNLLTH